jgi:ABC-type multidrug transport system fused ATPase/permease subunit
MGAWTVFLRLIRFARPYAAVLALAVLCSAAYAGGRSLRAYLVKPLFDDVVLPHYSLSGTGSASGWLPEWPGGQAEAEAGEGEAGPDLEPSLEPRAESEARERIAARVRDSFWNLLLAGLAIVLLIPVAHYGSIYLVAWGMGRVLVDIQRTLCAKLLALPLGFHRGMTRGERMARTTADAARAHSVLGLFFGDFAQEVLALLFGGALLFMISWQLALATLVAGPVVAGVIAVFGRRIRRSAQRRQESVGDVTQRLLEILSGIKVIKAFRAQEAEAESFERENRRLFRRSMRVVKNRALARTLVEALNNALAIGVLLGGALAVALGLWGLTLGSLAAFLLVMQTTYRPVKEMSRGWALLMDAIPSAERFLELLDAVPEPPDTPGARRIDGVKRGIRFERVCFSYGREPVLQDVDLEIEAGERVAIVGRTGAGKTTLADLLLRFYEPDSGRIEIDGVDLRRIARNSWLDQVAVVSQESFLFAGTIRDNIRYGRPGASDEEVEAAARAAHVHEFARRLPRGYETEVGELGEHISGGQRQRITIARALLRSPAVLIFDEATSSLDAQSERYVQEAVDILLEGRTTLVIAHRLSTVRNADRIVVLEKGRVVAVGPHGELMERGGLYRELVHLQTGDRQAARREA